MEGKCLLSALIRVEGARWERKVYEHRIKCPSSDGCAVEGCGMGSPPCQPWAAGQFHCSLISTTGCRELDTSPSFTQSRALLQGGWSGCLCKARQEPTTSSLLKPAGVPLLTPCTFPGLTEVGSPSSRRLRCGYHS